MVVAGLVALFLPANAAKYAHSDLGDAESSKQETDTMKVRVKRKSGGGTSYKWYEREVDVAVGTSGKDKADALADAWNADVDDQPSAFKASALDGSLTIKTKGGGEIVAVKYDNESEQDQKHRILEDENLEQVKNGGVSLEPHSFARVGVDVTFDDDTPGAVNWGDAVIFQGLVVPVSNGDTPSDVAARIHGFAVLDGQVAGLVGSSVWIWTNAQEPEVSWERNTQAFNGSPWVEAEL